MNKFLKLSFAAVLLVGFAVLLSSCKKTFDQPPSSADPNIVANTTLKSLKAMHTTSGAYDIINSDVIISGVVTANDKSGNFYKQLWIQDSTGGLQVLLDASSLFGTYPVGRRVFIRCQGLCISDYNGTMELGIKANVAGLPSLEGIPAGLISQYVIGGSLNNPVVPAVVTLSQLTTNMQDRYLGSLIQLDGYEFEDTTATYSDTSVYKSTTNRFIKPCSGASVIVRTSAYANFAGQKVAKGNGSITAIYTTFGSTKQLIIRDTTDVKFEGARCSIFEETFSSIGANSATLVLPGWKNIAEVGGALWQNAVFGSGPTKCAKITAFSTGQATVTSWLISPAINLAGITAPKLTFTTSAGFPSSATPNFRVYVSTTYNGGNTPSTFFTTQLPAQIATPVTGFSPFLSSGVLDLSAFANQTIYIGWRYDGSDPTKTATYELDDVKVLR